MRAAQLAEDGEEEEGGNNFAGGVTTLVTSSKENNLFAGSTYDLKKRAQWALHIACVDPPSKRTLRFGTSSAMKTEASSHGT